MLNWECDANIVACCEAGPIKMAGVTRKKQKLSYFQGSKWVPRMVCPCPALIAILRVSESFLDKGIKASISPAGTIAFHQPSSGTHKFVNAIWGNLLAWGIYPCSGWGTIFACLRPGNTPHHRVPSQKGPRPHNRTLSSCHSNRTVALLKLFLPRSLHLLNNSQTILQLITQKFSTCQPDYRRKISTYWST